MFSGTDQTGDLKKFDVPTIIIQGDDDQIVPCSDASALQAKLIKNATLKVYKGVPHGLCTTRKGPVNEDLRAFFKSEALREIKRGLPRRPFLKRDETGC